MYTVRIHKVGCLLRIEVGIEPAGKLHEGNIQGDKIVLYFVEGIVYFCQNSPSSTLKNPCFSLYVNSTSIKNAEKKIYKVENSNKYFKS